MTVQVERFHVDVPTSEAEVPAEILVADCCIAYGTRCPVRGGNDVCEAPFDYDADVMEGGEEGMLVCCICPCHGKPAQA